MASMAMTEQTPKTMPSAVSSERRRCSHRLLMPRRTVRCSRLADSPPSAAVSSEWDLSAKIAFKLSVAQADGAVRAFAHAGIVGDEDQGFALFVQLIEQ